MATTKIVRDASIRIKVQPETKLRLERLARLFGIPPATLASVWVGQALTQQERNLSLVGKMAETIGGEVGQAMREQMSMMPELFGQAGKEAHASAASEGEP